jgi:hypothetical protein
VGELAKKANRVFRTEMDNKRKKGGKKYDRFFHK